VRIFRSLRLKQFLARIDRQGLREIQKRHAGSTDRYAKYASAEPWLKINLRRVRELGLDRSDPKNILDLGCGAGFFLFLTQQLGHSGLGLDVDDFSVPNELIDLFQVRRETWRIRAFQPLPDFGRQFDLITGFSAAFNRNEDESRGWGAEEWRFFLDDLERRLKPGGMIVFEVNSGKDKRYFPPEVREFFLARGARIDGEHVRFQHGGTTSMSSG
jgi:SAM-dependent methyltransferase